MSTNTRDSARVVDTLIKDGKIISGEHSYTKMIGSVEVLHKSAQDGKPIFTKRMYHNDLLVTGSVFLSEKANNVRSTFLTLPLDVEHGVHTIDEVDRTSDSLPLEQICGIMVGNEGAGDTYNTVRKVNRTARSVPGMIPFRVVPVDQDLAGEIRSRYILRVVRGDLVYYYGKKFEIDREINVEFEDGTPVPLDVDTVVNPKFVKVYTKYRVTLDQTDIREFAKHTYGSTKRSLINSVGLLTGYPGVAADGAEEFFNVRGMTTANMENQELKDSESTITFIYKVYIV